MVEATSPFDASRAVQPVPLLTTKLYVPPARPNLVPRPRLTERLNQGLHGKLILISAPAGFGKTTLLSEWRTTFPARDLPFAWLSLDEGDNDPTRFWAYTIAALQRIQSNLAEAVLSALRARQQPPIEWLLAELINELAALPQDFELVLDDYHFITNDAIHRALAFLLEHQPPPMHLVIASRADPPLPLPRLRSRSQVVELRADDLRFTMEEMAAFLHQNIGLTVTPEQVVTLDARTEGWIAGLQLAVLSMAEQADAAAFLAGFRGDDRHILDYLMEEVLQQQPAEVHDFLLKTSVLQRLCGPLCDALTERADGQAMLVRLEAANLFVVPLDNRRQWYRYHHLFADMLQMRLPQAFPGQMAELHRRAAGWYEQQDLLEEAIPHALAAQDFTNAARLIETVFTAMWWDQRERDTVRDWVDKLPTEVLHSRPWLCIIKAWIVLDGYSGQLNVARRVAQAEEWLQEAERLLQVVTVADSKLSAESRRRRGWLLNTRLWQAFWRGEPVPAGLPERAIALLPEEDREWRRQVMVVSAGLPWTWGDVLSTERALRPLTQQFDLAKYAMVGWGVTLWERGYLRAAADHYGRAEQYEGYYSIGSLGSSILRYEWNDLDGAIQRLEESFHHAEYGIGWRPLWATVELAKAYQAKGEGQRAADLMVQAVPMAIALGLEWNAQTGPSSVRALQALLWLRQGHLDAAARWAESSGLSLDDEPSFRHLIGHLTLARLCIAQGRAQEALPLLRRLQRHAEAQGRERNRIEILAVQAISLHQQGISLYGR